MINQNGALLSEDDFKLTQSNRAFKYGDGIFDTLKYEDDTIEFLEDHYFRLMSSLRMLRMKIPMKFTMSFYEEQIRSTLDANGLEHSGRIRVNVYRREGGLYAPETNEIDFVIETGPLKTENPGVVEIELFKDFTLASGLLSTVKTNNCMVNVLGSVFAKENNYQNCLLINERKEIVEALNANVFVIKDGMVLTPALESGCINGIIRKKLVEAMRNDQNFTIRETAISPFELLKADEVFLTNSIIAMQSVDKYRKKTYKNTITEEIKILLSQIDK